MVMLAILAQVALPIDVVILLLKRCIEDRVEVLLLQLEEVDSVLEGHVVLRLLHVDLVVFVQAFDVHSVAHLLVGADVVVPDVLVLVIVVQHRFVPVVLLLEHH